MFGAQKEEEEVKSNPEGGEGVEKGDPISNIGNPEPGSTAALFTGIPEGKFPNRGENEFPSDSKSLQTIVKSTLEDFYTAIERLKTVTVEIDKVSIGAENWLKSNN